MAQEDKPNVGGRPRKEIDEELVENLAKINCSLKEIASCCKVSVDTLTARYSDVIERAREMGKSSLKKKQFEVAMKGNVSMLIWLGKIILGQKDPGFDIKFQSEELAKMPTEELVKLAESKIKELKQ